MPKKENSNQSYSGTKAWIEKVDWKEGWEVTPHESIDFEELAKQYSLHPKRWQKAFEFLSKKNLRDIEPGRYWIDKGNVYANVDEYTTKDEHDTKFEAHKVFADIQYMVVGEEQIGMVDLSTTSLVTPYNEERDISFFTSPRNNYLHADSSHFFIFFPHNAHRPCFKLNANTPVRKVVVKVRVN